MKTIDRAIRWEGNNLPAIRDFIKDLPAVLETEGTRAHIVIMQGPKVLLEIYLNDGDGLLRQGHLLGVARNIVYSSEIRKEDEQVH